MKIINNKNCGLVETQLINLTNKIKKIHLHCIKNKKDFHSNRGLIFKISKRRKLLKYLKKNSLIRYNNILSFLDLKK
ncbi:30S ribosomal protein S15 [endosymbiont of Euscepes postfasciatus]|nr:30S ribosomal protein S15 [endosymbiont of Euscepes postfasciatus]